MNSGTRDRTYEILYAYFNDCLPSKLEEGILEWFAGQGHEEEKYAVLEELWYELITENHHLNGKLLECYREITLLLDFPPEAISIKPIFRFPWSWVGKIAAVIIPTIVALFTAWYVSQPQDENPAIPHSYNQVGSNIKTVIYPSK